MKEVKAKRVAGPFLKPPFKNYTQSPIGLVPKKASGSDQTRLIFHLSYDFKENGLHSVKYFTPKEKCSVKYKDLDYTVRMYLKLYDSCKGEIDCSEDDEKPVPQGQQIPRKRKLNQRIKNYIKKKARRHKHNRKQVTASSKLTILQENQTSKVPSYCCLYQGTHGTGW